MSKISIDRDKVEVAKRTAEQVIASQFHQLERFSSVSLERCVLRLMGVSGSVKNSKTGIENYPLVNEVIEALSAEVLSMGIGYWFGLAAIHHPKLSPNQIAEKIISREIKLTSLKAVPHEKIRQVCQEMLKPSLDKLRQLGERRSKRPPWRSGRRPLQLSLVKADNLEKVLIEVQEQAELGADLIQVQRSSAQSLLGYIPEGNPGPGDGGIYFTQENLIAIREVLDKIEKRTKHRIGLAIDGSGLCMAEMALMAGFTGVDYLINDPLASVFFREININRNLVDQFAFRRFCSRSMLIFDMACS